MTSTPGAANAAADDQHAAAALERAVYLLDRMLAPVVKARAFHRAAGVARELGDAELREIRRRGKLTDLPGIGSTTAKVISEALDGEVPAYVARLETESVVPLPDAARPYRAALKGDCHAHTTWSDGGASIEDMARTAMALGHDYLVITDHSPRLTVAHGLSTERLMAQLDEIGGLNERLAPFRLLTGIEVDIHEDGTLDHDDEVLARLDVVVASAHSKLRLDEQAMTRRLVLAAANPHVDILGHVTNRKLSSDGEQPASDSTPKRPPSRFDPDLVFAACARFGTAVEINCRPERQDPPDDLLRLALEWECFVSIDTDAHAPGQLEWQPYGCAKAAACDVPIERIVNTWTADELAAWTRDHPGR